MGRGKSRNKAQSQKRCKKDTGLFERRCVHRLKSVQLRDTAQWFQSLNLLDMKMSLVLPMVISSPGLSRFGLPGDTGFSLRMVPLVESLSMRLTMFPLTRIIACLLETCESFRAKSAKSGSAPIMVSFLVSLYTA